MISLKDKATQLGHVGHQGIENTKNILHKNICNPSMDIRVKETIDKCIAY